jgi:hypothetical protein
VATDARPRLLEFLNCQAYLLQYQGDADKMQQLMPREYAPTILVANVEIVGLNVYSCLSVVIDGRTVIKDVRFFTVTAGVTAPSDIAGPDGQDDYEFEQVVTAPEVQDAFRRNGFHAALGDVKIATTAQILQATFTRDGGALYEYTGAGLLGNGSATFSIASRVHQANETMRAWYDLSYNLHAPSVLGEVGLLTTHGGAIEATKLFLGNVAPINSGVGWIDFTVSFPQ